MSKRSSHPKRKSPKAVGGRADPPGKIAGLSDLMDDLRQCAYPTEWRITRPPNPILPLQPVATPTPELPKPAELVREVDPPETPLSALAEVATCIWYLKTKHFKREWHNEDTSDDDPRIRRTLGRLNKGTDALRKCGLEVADPTGKRYPTGGEAMMRPLDFVPTQGVAHEKVTEAVMPLVYWHGRLIQRAEVFVAVPPTAAVPPERPMPPAGASSAPLPASPSPDAPAPQEPQLTTRVTSNTASMATGAQA